MTTRDELLEILEHGENSVVEFKRDDLKAQDLAKELVAFSNLQGGMVILGVEPGLVEAHERFTVRLFAKVPEGESGTGGDSIQ